MHCPILQVQPRVPRCLSPDHKRLSCRAKLGEPERKREKEGPDSGCESTASRILNDHVQYDVGFRCNMMSVYATYMLFAQCGVNVLKCS